MLYSLIEIYELFGWTCRFYLQSSAYFSAFWRGRY